MTSFFRRAKTPTRWRASSRECEPERARARSPDPPLATRPDTPGTHPRPNDDISRFRPNEDAPREEAPRPTADDSSHSHRLDHAATMPERRERLRPAIPPLLRTDRPTPPDDTLVSARLSPEGRHPGTPGGSHVPQQPYGLSGSVRHSADRCRPTNPAEVERVPFPDGTTDRNGILRRPGTPAEHHSRPRSPDQAISNGGERYHVSSPVAHRTADRSESPEPGNPHTASSHSETDRGRPTRPSLDRRARKKLSSFLQRRGGNTDNERMYDKVVNYGSELKDRARSRVRRGSTASQRPAPPPEFLPQPQTLEDALTHLAELQYTSNQHLRNLALAEERLSRVEIEHDILKAEVDRLLSFKEEAKVLGLQVVGLRKAVLESQKDAAAANDNARHADMAREIDARRNDERIRILEGELADVRDKWRWLKQHCGFRETYSGFVGQALHDYSTWEAFWTKATAANSKGAEEGRGSEEFDTWLRFQEEQEDYVRAALKGELAAHRATWEHEMVDERAAFDAQRCEWDTQKACMVENEARLRTQIADMAYEQIQANAAMEVKIDNLTEYLKTSEAEQKRMHADLDAAKEVEDGLRARLAACPDMRELLVANDTELRLRARLETYKEIIEGYETRLQAIVPELKVEKRKHADYRRVAAGLQRENERLRAEARRSAKESEDEFHDTLEIIESHAA